MAIFEDPSKQACTWNGRFDDSLKILGPPAAEYFLQFVDIFKNKKVTYILER